MECWLHHMVEALLSKISADTKKFKSQREKYRLSTIMSFKRTITCTPIFILAFCSEKSRQAILALTIFFGMAWLATVQFRA